MCRIDSPLTHAVLEGFFGWRDCQHASPPRKARFDLGLAFDRPLIADYLMPHQSSVLQADFVDYFCHIDLLIKPESLWLV
jgi:hypothetical protein